LVTGLITERGICKANREEHSSAFSQKTNNNEDSNYRRFGTRKSGYPEKSERDINVETPYGSPSSAFKTGQIEGIEVAILSRHGRQPRNSTFAG
jgi:hypothetical protein